jgi:hypothetical protein
MNGDKAVDCLIDSQINSGGLPRFVPDGRSEFHRPIICDCPHEIGRWNDMIVALC